MGQQLRTYIPHVEDLELILSTLQQPPGIPIPRNLMASFGSQKLLQANIYT